MSIIRHIPAPPSFKNEILFAGTYPEIHYFPAGSVDPLQLSSSLLAHLTTSLSGNIGEYNLTHDNQILHIDHPEDYGERYRKERVIARFHWQGKVVGNVAKMVLELRSEVQMLRSEVQMLRLEVQMQRLEKQAVKSHLRSVLSERELVRRVTVEWETHSRLAQALNDTVKRQVLRSHWLKPQAECIWAHGRRWRYLPKLLSTWFLSKYRDDPRELLNLPLSLQRLIDEGNFDPPHPKNDLPPEISRAAELIWTEYRPIVDAMLGFYHRQPTDRNRIIHQPPTMADAIQIVLTSNIPTPVQNLAQVVICSGRKQEDSNWVPLFTGAILSPSDREFDAQVARWAASRARLS